MSSVESTIESAQSLVLANLIQLAYDPIDSKNGEIRLVELAPGRYEDPIRISLHTKEINDPIQYEALSYAWGTAVSSQRLLVDGIPLRVTESLNLGLRRLRYDDRSRMIWIDALCINQQDVRERSHQVQQMATIYMSAKNVVIWLGEWPELEDCSNPAECQKFWMLMLGTEHPLLPPSEHIYDHILAILGYPWFRRLWIIQEFALARSDPIVLVGNQVTHWSTLNKALRYIRHVRWGFSIDESVVSVHLTQLEDAWERVDALNKIRSGPGSRRSLYWCLVLSQHAVATDPRDKVYGLLGLCDYQFAEPIVPDYSKSLSQILAEVTVVAIVDEKAIPYLDITVQPAESFARASNMPSWVINFLALEESCDLGTLYGSTVYDLNRNLKERDRRRGSVRLSVDYLTLYTHGRYVGTISATQPYFLDLVHDNGGTRDTKLYDYFHGVLKPKDITPRIFLQALLLQDSTDVDSDHFATLLLGSKAEFHPDITIEDCSLFVTEEWLLGSSWHLDSFDLQVGDILVCLFGTEVPFILRSITTTSSHRMISVAYVPGYGDRILNRPNFSSLRGWIDFAAEGGQEYAIV